MYFFVVNPIAGNNRGKAIWSYIKNRLDELALPYRAEFTKRAGHASEIVKTALQQSKLKAIVAVGGDGTVNEVGSALVGTDIPMGYIPAGTGNDYALAHRIPFHPHHALQRILQHQTYQIDTAELHNRRMISFMGAGFDGKVAETVNLSRWKRRWFGRLTYGLEALKILRSYKPQTVSITVDGRQYQYENVWLIAVNNTPNYAGGIKICPKAEMNDGYLDLCCVQNVTSGQLLRILPAAYRGKHIRHPSIIFHRGKEITIEADSPLVIHVDGEVIGKTPITVKMVPKSLSVL